MRRLMTGLLVLLLMSASAHADQFVIDKQHTDVRFSWDHLGLSRQSGKFTDVAGTVDFDPDKPEDSKVKVTITLSSLITGVPPLDSALLKTKDYFDATTNPAITFQSTSVHTTGDKSAELRGD